MSNLRSISESSGQNLEFEVTNYNSGSDSYFWVRIWNKGQNLFERKIRIDKNMKSKSAEYRKNNYCLKSLFFNLKVELNNVRFRNFQIVRGLIVQLKFWCTWKINFYAFIARIIISQILYFLYMTCFKSHLTYFDNFWFLKFSKKKLWM